MYVADAASVGEVADADSFRHSVFSVKIDKS